MILQTVAHSITCNGNKWLLQCSFTEKDAFVGYQEDTCAAVVYSCLYENKEPSEECNTDDLPELKVCQCIVFNNMHDS